MTTFGQLLPRLEKKSFYMGRHGVFHFGFNCNGEDEFAVSFVEISWALNYFIKWPRQLVAAS